MLLYLEAGNFVGSHPMSKRKNGKGIGMTSIFNWVSINGFIVKFSGLQKNYHRG
jgi:hypothetical protein